MTPEEAHFREELIDRRQRAERSAARVGPRPDLAALLARIDEALGEIEGGTYGLCRTCHDPIETELLRADPLAQFCLDHLDRAARDRLQADLDLAARIQQRLLPSDPAAGPHWRTARAYLPAGPVGGDVFDLVAGDGGDLTFVLGDVAGKGVAAALLMSNLQATFRALAPIEPDASRLAARINHLFCRSILESHYATLVVGCAAIDGRIELCNAGHVPALLVGRGGVRELGATGLPAGMFCEGAYEAHRLALEPGEALLMVTDGVTEARDAAGGEYGLPRLAARASALAGRPAEELVAACRADLEDFHAGVARGDDVTLFALERAGRD
ncbi:MAG: SpoIIE family protein phosphatase [Acidobacteria bacterium]|jgi:sigma-B regulation protein RsbU (phosphoserine phosphatase)|nr:SpoIIE family protein phosphatase [Acidobacteriota bacterium]MCU0253025.1 SpoIIE family protein phosphatase [Acidobacteriota bacterium]